MPRHALPAGLPLVYGLGGTAAALAGAYVLRLPAVDAPGPVAAGPFVLCLFGACAMAGRSAQSASGVRAGALTGLVYALACLIALGSAITESSNPAAMTAAWLLGAPAIGALCGTFAGRETPTPPADAHAWLTRLTVVTAASSLFLLLMGGVVTSTEHGLAVPDSVTTFGQVSFLFPLSEMTGGVYIEHAHRLFGSLIGLMTLTVMVRTLTLKSTSPGVRRLAVLTFLFVVAQGVMGMTRVSGGPTITDDLAAQSPNKLMGVVHGVSGQLFVATVALLATTMCSAWRNATPAPTPKGNRPSRARALHLWALLALVLQIVFGAFTRHYSLHSEGDHSSHPLLAHIVFSLVAAGLLMAAGFGTKKAYKPIAPLRITGTATAHATSLQMLLGLGALIAALLSAKQEGARGAMDVVFTTAHQTNGAVLLCAAALMTAWGVRLLPRKTPA